MSGEINVKSGAALLGGPIGLRDVPEVPKHTAVTGSGYGSILFDSTQHPNGKATNVKLRTVGGELTVTNGDVTGKAGGAFRQKIVNGAETVEFLANASVDFKTPLGQTNISGAAELNTKTGVWLLSPGARLTIKTPTGNVTISGAFTFDMSTGLMTKNNQQISLDLDKQTALVFKRALDRNGTQDGVGVTHNFNDPKLALTVLATLSENTGILGAQVGAKWNFTPDTTVEGTYHTNYHDTGPRGILELRHNFKK